MTQIQLDGWDAILIAIAIAIVVSVLKDFYKTWRKKKNNPYKDSGSRHEVRVWLPDGSVDMYEGAVNVDIRDLYICIYFEDGSEIEYEGVKFRVLTTRT